ncbi:hypothetical protein D9M72_541750 [compost metagenome]
MGAGNGRLGSGEPCQDPGCFDGFSGKPPVKLRVLPKFGHEGAEGHGTFHRGEGPPVLPGIQRCDVVEEGGGLFVL